MAAWEAIEVETYCPNQGESLALCDTYLDVTVAGMSFIYLRITQSTDTEDNLKIIPSISIFSDKWPREEILKESNRNKDW